MSETRRTAFLALSLVLCLASCGDGSRRVAAPDAPAGADTLAPEDTPAPDADTIPDSALDATPPDTSAGPETSVPDTAADTALPDTVAAEVAVETDATPDAGPTCLALAPGHRRHVVVSRPYAEPDGAQAARWQLMPLEADGTLGAVVADFTLGRAYEGTVAFRADGALAVTAHDDGTLGVFAIDGEGAVTVLEESLDTGAYIHEVHVLGDRLLLVDGNWQVNGGGIYEAPLACDGSVGAATLLYPTKLAQSLVVRGDTHIVAALEAVTTQRGTVHLVARDGDAWSRLDGADLFPDDEDFLASLAVTLDGRFALVGDNQEFTPSIDNRVGVASVASGKLVARDPVTPLLDPVALVASPHDDAVLVVSGYGDAVHVLDYDPGRDPPFIDQGEPLYVASRPALPGDAVLVGGAFPDLVLVAENQAIRRFRFAGNGQVTDLGRTAEGEGYDKIPGALGVQP